MVLQQNSGKLAARMFAITDPTDSDGSSDPIKDCSGDTEDQDCGQSEKQQGAQTADDDRQYLGCCVEAEYKICHCFHHPFRRK